MDKTEIAIIGGTGSQILLENSKETKIYTPFGNTSSRITIGNFQGKSVSFISRHGLGHVIPPHKINYRANIWALKELGVKYIISTSAVGSLKKEHPKKKFLMIDQYVDRTKKRIDTFYEGGELCHIGQADPYCVYLNELFYTSGKDIDNVLIQNGGTYVCIEGPRFSTRSESKVFRQWGGDIIGMTAYPEVVLAAEKEICYCCIAMVTDLDVWAGSCPNCGIVEIRKICPQCGAKIDPLEVDVNEVLETQKENITHLKAILETTIPKIDTERDCSCRHRLEGSIL
ncbi:MAG: MTAP family purine nucleoside phosphorylase [Candidatus Lokiarchaeota archaeon]|jgi:5'-methylthioadenosine phosphorylase